MHIKATCPQCESTYQVDPGLKGKRMRCPNPICRAVFEVRDGTAPPPPVLPAAVASTPKLAPPSPPPPKRPAAVSEMVPVLPAQVAEETNPVDDLFADARPLTVAGPQMPSTEGPAFENWEAAPPVRPGPDSSSANGAVVASNIQLHSVERNGQEHTEYAVHHPSSRRRNITLTTLATLTVAAVVACVCLLNSTAPNDETERSAKADKEFASRNFAEAADLYRSLARDFPQSDQAQAYHLHAELSGIQEAIFRIQTDADTTRGNLNRLRSFLETYEGLLLIDKHKANITESLFRLVEDLTAFANSDKRRDLLETARKLNSLASKKYNLPPVDQAKRIHDGFEAAELQVAKSEQRKQVIDFLNSVLAAPSWKSMEDATQKVKAAGLTGDPELAKLLGDLPEQHRKSIKYSAEVPNLAAPSAVEDGPPNMAVMPYRGARPPATSIGNKRPAFALVRGVLYAVDQHTGKMIWTRRVGIDTATLPLWLPATAVSPPTVVVSSSDANGLIALNANDGTLRWSQPLPEPCTGQPLLFDNLLIVACRGGAILEIDALSGDILGGYHVGQELTHGGVRHPGTNQVYFAANRGCVYVLDLEQRQCAGILYTGHPSGSLRCPPVVVLSSRGDVVDPTASRPALGRLLLCLDNGQHSTELVTYTVPITDSRAASISLTKKLDGRVWDSPLSNQENLSLATDAGRFLAFGLRQPDNRDTDLFPMLNELLQAQSSTDTDGRASVVHSDGQHFWIMSQGQLHYLQASMYSKEGWRIVQRRIPLDPLGTPLHAGQVMIDDQGRATLFLVTEAPVAPLAQREEGGVCWMTAVDMDQLSIRWQRQIGFVPASNGLTFPANGAVVAWDRGGELLQFDPVRFGKLPAASWQNGGKQLVRDQSGPAWLFPGGDSQSVFALKLHGLQTRIWKYRDGIAEPLGKPLALNEPISGTPALLGDSLILPLAKGRLIRLGQNGILNDEEWQSPQADKNSQGHALAIGSARLVCTNGSQGLTLWQLDGNGLAKIRTAEVKGRIITPPALLPNSGPQGEFRLCVADVGRTVTLLQGDMLSKVREWMMSDAITAGPFVREGNILLVVGGRRLVCLDPERREPLWAHTFRADVVGEPLVIDGHLIVADESGLIQAQDMKTGNPIGPGYTMREAVAPASTPLPFGADRLFIPLTDGTVLLPSRSRFGPDH